MLGLGLGEYVPYVIYGLSFAVTLLAVFYRSAIGILFLVPLFPIYVILHKAIKSELFMANNIIDMVILGIILGLLFQGNSDEEHSLGLPPQLLPILILMALSLAGFFMGTSYLGDGLTDERTVARLAAFKNYMILPVLYVLAFYGLRERKWKYALYILLFFTILAADYKFKLTFRWYHHTRYSHDIRVGDTFAYLNSNVWGAFHAMYTLMLVGLFLVDRHRWRRAAYGILIVGGVYSLLYSYSRGAYAAFAAGLFFIAIVRSRVLLIPLFGLFLFWKIILPSSVVDRIEMTFMETSEEVSTVTVGDTYLQTAGRKEIWEQGMEMFSSSPVMGTGFETFGEVTGMDAHNQYLKMLVEQGAIGLMIYLLLYYNALRGGWRLYRNGEEELIRALGFGFLCSVVASMVANFFGDRWSYLQVGGIYWVSWALVDQENRKLELLREGLSTEDGIENALPKAEEVVPLRLTSSADL